ncbi:MAG: SRPBCC family protein [Bryobacteraceae bacterium]
MPATISEQSVKTLEVVREQNIAAPLEIVWECILEQMGPLNENPDGAPLPMVIEPWPGGRWFRDLGNNTGHFWGVVQSIKPPSLLEIHGPLFMSAPVVSHVLYRLSSENGITQVKFSHRALGQIDPRLLDGVQVNRGWGSLLARIARVSEMKSQEKRS